MSERLPAPAASNTFERIKRVNSAGAEFWSARELSRVLEYSDFRNFIAVISKAREACANSGHTVSDHFVDFTEMVGIGSGAVELIPIGHRYCLETDLCKLLCAWMLQKLSIIITDLLHDKICNTLWAWMLQISHCEKFVTTCV